MKHTRAMATKQEKQKSELELLEKAVSGEELSEKEQLSLFESKDHRDFHTRLRSLKEELGVNEGAETVDGELRFEKTEANETVEEKEAEKEEPKKEETKKSPTSSKK
jgi:hypothetical protein